MGMYTEVPTSSDDEGPECEGGMVVEDGIVRVTKNYRSRRKLVKDLEYWRTRRDNVISLNARAEKVAEVVMTQEEKERLVKEVSEIDNYYHLKEILRIISVFMGDPTVDNMVEYEFNAEVLDNPTLRAVESLVFDPDAYADRKLMDRIEGFIDFLEEELEYFDTKEQFAKARSKPTSSAEKRKRVDNGKVSAVSGSAPKRSRTRVARSRKKIVDDDDDVDVEMVDLTHSADEQDDSGRDVKSDSPPPAARPKKRARSTKSDEVPRTKKRALGSKTTDSQPSQKAGLNVERETKKPRMTMREVEILPLWLHEKMQNGDLDGHALAETVLHHACRHADLSKKRFRQRTRNTWTSRLTSNGFAPDTNPRNLSGKKLDKYQALKKKFDDESEEHEFEEEIKHLADAFFEAVETLMETRQAPKELSEPRNKVCRRTLKTMDRIFVKMMLEALRTETTSTLLPWGIAMHVLNDLLRADAFESHECVLRGAPMDEKYKIMRQSLVITYDAALCWLSSLPRQEGLLHVRIVQKRNPVPLLLPRNEQIWAAIRSRYSEEQGVSTATRLGLPLSKSVWLELRKRFNKSE